LSANPNCEFVIDLVVTKAAAVVAFELIDPTIENTPFGKASG
jgi:hypothetical protein